MNKIIAELYDQAIVIESGGDYVCGELDPEKFAELIVQECLTKCDEIQTMYGQFTFTAKKCKKAIQQHFGVSDEEKNT
jgi:hypothetical protein